MTVPLDTRDDGAAARPGRARSAMSAVILSLIVLGLIVAVAPVVLVLQARSHALTEAEHELKSLSLTLAEQAERAFEEVHLVQTTFMEMARTNGVQTPDAFRERMATHEVYNELTAHSDALPQLEILGLMDTEGNFVNVSRTWPVPRLSIGDRPYFLALKNDPASTSIISDPLTHRMTHQEVVAVAHRISASDGRFLGVSVGGMRMGYFEDLYSKVATDADMAVSLFRSDGVLLARYPRQEESIGKSFAEGTAVGADGYVTVRTSRIDNADRMIASHALAKYPMLVSVSTTVSSILAPWRRQAFFLIAAAVVLELMVAGSGTLMLRQMRSQRRLSEAEAQLALGRERERADHERHVQAVRFAAAVRDMSPVLCMFDPDDRLILGSDRLGEVFGLSPQAIISGDGIEDLRAILSAADGVAGADGATVHRLITGLRAGGVRASHVLDLKDGRTLTAQYAPMEYGGWLVTLEDVTAQRLVERRIAHMAHHDALTGLANRVKFHEQLAEAVARAKRGCHSALLMLDLDHFKAVNDTLGHPVGDALLREVTRRLKNEVRETDTVARLGGDEFAIVLACTDDAAGAAGLATRLIASVSEPYEFGGDRVVIGTSVGIVVMPDDGDDPDLLMKNADLALYNSKSNGRGCYRFFEPQMNAYVQARRALELDLRKALEQKDFRVFYQPQVSVADRTIEGFEALVRWEHPRRGIVSPADFIPLCEETGLIVELGKWVLRQACEDAAAWPRQLTLAVNLSPVQLASHTLVEDVAAALADSGLAAENLELEITESAMLADTAAVLATLHALRDLGLSISLDDFGTGYSSLSYLQRFPFHEVKIDRTFVGKLGQDRDNDTIVAAVIDLCHRLGVVTTGEGVENEAQLRYLASLRCDRAQGYLLGRPAPADKVAEMLLELEWHKSQAVAAI